MKSISVGSFALDALTVSNDTTVMKETMEKLYEGMFDDFHFDIGHGKGTGDQSMDGHSHGDDDYAAKM